jgi:hypothetical protein
MFWLIASEVSVSGWFAPLLWACCEAKRVCDGAHTSWWTGSREGDCPCWLASSFYCFYSIQAPGLLDGAAHIQGTRWGWGPRSLANPLCPHRHTNLLCGSQSNQVDSHHSGSVLLHITSNLVSLQVIQALQVHSATIVYFSRSSIICFSGFKDIAKLNKA